MGIRNILATVLLLTSLHCASQTLHFNHLTSADGISQSEVYTFLEDSRGFMWFGTVDGLNRYDGYTIKVYNTDKNNPNSLSNNTIRSLAEDYLGRIWIGTDDGLNYFDPRTDVISQVKVNSSENKFSVWSLLIHENNLFIGTNDGLWMTKIPNKNQESIEAEIQQITYLSGMQNEVNLIRTLIASKHGGIWVQTSINVMRMVIEKSSNKPIIIETISVNSFSNQVTAVEDSTGNLWLASENNGLLRYIPKTKEIHHFSDFHSLYGPSSKKCSALALDRKGNLWIGTLDNGLNFINANELNKEKMHFERIQNEPINSNSLNSNLIYTLYVSKNNQIWVGTIGSGINIFNPAQKKFVHYKFRNPSSEFQNSNFIRSVFVDNKDRIWTGTHGNGLFLFNREKETFQKLGFETQTVFFISRCLDNKKFVCTSSGIYLVEVVNNRLVIHSQSSNDMAVFNVISSKPDVFWVAAIDGLQRIHIANDEIIVDEKYNSNTQPGISNDNCRVIFYDQDNNELLLGTEGGGLNVISLDENHYARDIRVYKKNNELNTLSNNYVRSIIRDSDENIWLGTYEGLNKIICDSISGRLSFKSYTKDDMLPNNMIQLLVEDDNKCLWIGTNGGLVKFTLSTEQFIHYTESDGIQSNEFSEHTVYKKEDGEIIMGGINGITAFYPDQIEMSSIEPITTLTGFYLFNKKVRAREEIGRKVLLEKSITLTDTIVLLPKQKNFGFDFSAMIFPNAEKIHYAYKLEGFNKDWQYTDASNRNANYTNLRHGKYIFKVKASNSDGIWENSHKEVFIHLQTPFFYTWFAYLLYFLVVVLMFIYFSHFTIIRYTTKKKLLLEKNHSEKLHELDVLRTRFFINISHDLRTPLTLINGPLDILLQNKIFSSDVKEKLQLIKRNVKRLNYLVEQLLDVRKAESGKLIAKKKSEDIVSFTKAELTHFSYAFKRKGLELIIDSKSERIMSCFDATMISKVYFNIISNAIKFTEKGDIKINIEIVDKNNYEILGKDQFNSFVKVEVRDTGIGMSEEQRLRIFERFYQDQKQTTNGYGIGLSHTKELIDAHGGYIELESKIDLGTTIRFYLPDTEIFDNSEINATSSTEDLYFDSETVVPAEPDQNNKSKKTILVVEDNVDMRSFIKSELKKEYNVIEAGNGLEGLKKSKDNIIDLVVSDVMMPKMDGIELCEKYKSNIKTSHIPFILLTAKVDLETKYEGIETGADDYIPKPFEMEYLLIRIKNLFHSRENLRKLFQKNHIIEPSAITVSSLDEKFLTSLMEEIEEGISDSNFSITFLEAKMGMSHANFYRKVKSLTGQSGQELMLNIRMKRAYQLLSDNKDLRISDVAYMVGFTNPKYFSSCFKEEYGFAPSNLIK